ncbi:unnamed protein product [Durusdinium trenchii]
MVFLGFIAASLAINIVVLVPVCFGLYSDGDRMKDVYGAETPARGILKAIYTAILLVSSGLFPCIFMAKVGTGAQFMAVGLFVVQIIYKFLTLVTTKGGVPPGLPLPPGHVPRRSAKRTEPCGHEQPGHRHLPQRHRRPLPRRL